MIELIVALGVVVLASYIFTGFVQNSSVSVSKLSKKVSTNQSNAIIGKNISKAITTGTIRFYSFNSNNSKIRTIIPMPERCGNLEKHIRCKEDTSLLFVKYLSVPSLSVICRLNNGDFIIDLENKTYGSASHVTKGFDVSSAEFPSGTVEVSKGKILALNNPPFAYLVKVKSAPSAYSVNEAQFAGHAQFHSDCISKLQMNGTNYKTTKLYKVSLDPLHITDLSGNSSPSASVLNFAAEDYPLKTYNVSLETFGRRIVNGKESVGFSKCNFQNGTSDNISCADGGVFQVPSIKRLRLDFKFKVAFMDSASVIQEKALWYEVVSNAQTPTCQEPYEQKCQAKKLLLNNIDDIPYMTLSETKTTLKSEVYTSYKQEEIEFVRLRFLSNDQKEEGFHAYFP